MKKSIVIIAFSTLLANCANEKCGTRQATNYDITGRCELTDSTHLIVVRLKEKNYQTVFVSQSQYNELKSLKKFTIDFTCPPKEYGTITSITPLKELDTTSLHRELFMAEAKDIEDFKRRSRGSYTIIEQQDRERMIVVRTPSQEISNMLRLEDFRFYYFKDWEGNYCFDHIETE